MTYKVCQALRECCKFRMYSITSLQAGRRGTKIYVGEAGIERVSVERCAADEGDLICVDESWGV